jgi:hypothetical protein
VRTSRGTLGVLGLSLLTVALVWPLQPAQASTHLNQEACNLLHVTGLPGINGQSGYQDVGAYGCENGDCDQKITDPQTGAYECQYARNALLAITCHQSPKRAHGLVDRLVRHAGYQRTHLSVDGAIKHNDQHATIAMALDRSTVEFVLAAASDTQAHPTWDNVDRYALSGADKMIDVWRHRVKIGKIC